MHPLPRSVLLPYTTTEGLDKSAAFAMPCEKTKPWPRIRAAHGSPSCGTDIQEILSVRDAYLEYAETHLRRRSGTARFSLPRRSVRFGISGSAVRLIGRRLRSCLYREGGRLPEDKVPLATKIAKRPSGLQLFPPRSAIQGFHSVVHKGRQADKNRKLYGENLTASGCDDRHRGRRRNGYQLVEINSGGVRPFARVRSYRREV